jgi:hypothetical protein
MSKTPNTIRAAYRAYSSFIRANRSNVSHNPHHATVPAPTLEQGRIVYPHIDRARLGVDELAARKPGMFADAAWLRSICR